MKVLSDLIKALALICLVPALTFGRPLEVSGGTLSGTRIVHADQPATEFLYVISNIPAAINGLAKLHFELPGCLPDPISLSLIHI